jgi:hypothetical protein
VRGQKHNVKSAYASNVLNKRDVREWMIACMMIREIKYGVNGDGTDNSDPRKGRLRHIMESKNGYSIMAKRTRRTRTTTQIYGGKTMTETCPKCHKETLRVINVMGSTDRISYHCSNCCYKEKRDYQGNLVEQSKILDAELLQKQQRAPHKFRDMIIREVPIQKESKNVL